MTSKNFTPIPGVKAEKKHKSRTSFLIGGILLLMTIGIIIFVFNQQVKKSKFQSITPTTLIPTKQLLTIAPKLNNEKSCTLEAKICSDGSSVGRTGPNCEFAKCPGDADEIINWRIYENKNLGITFKYPATWTYNTEQSTYAEVITFKGIEGLVTLGIGSGFGGGCPVQDRQKLSINGEDKDICHGSNENGSEYWSQIYWSKNNKTIALGAQTNSPSTQNNKVILNIFSTFHISK